MFDYLKKIRHAYIPVTKTYTIFKNVKNIIKLWSNVLGREVRLGSYFKSCDSDFKFYSDSSLDS